MAFCPNCGTEVNEDAKFCPACGSHVARNTVAPVRSTQDQLTQQKVRRRNLVPASISDQLPAMVHSQLVRLPAEQQSEFVEGFNRKRKSTGVAYLLWFILGIHYIYLGKLGWQILYWLTLGGFFIWTLIDLFRIPSIIRNYNRDVSVDVLRRLKVVTSD